MPRKTKKPTTATATATPAAAKKERAPRSPEHVFMQIRMRNFEAKFTTMIKRLELWSDALGADDELTRAAKIEAQAAQQRCVAVRNSLAELGDDWRPPSNGRRSGGGGVAIGSVVRLREKAAAPFREVGFPEEDLTGLEVLKVVGQTVVCRCNSEQEGRDLCFKKRELELDPSPPSGSAA